MGEGVVLGGVEGVLGDVGGHRVEGVRPSAPLGGLGGRVVHAADGRLTLEGGLAGDGVVEDVSLVVGGWGGVG